MFRFILEDFFQIQCQQVSVVHLLGVALGLLCSVQSLDGEESNDVTSLPVSAVAGLPSRIAFGSCAHQDKPQPILDVVRMRKPQLFVYLGDNIYGDTRVMDELGAKYKQLGDKPEFQRLRKNVAVVSIWDDHDYGENDAGYEYPMKESSRQIFCDFWQIPFDSPRRQRPGIYGVHKFKEGRRTLQLILLDTRWFRSPLRKNPDPLPSNYPFKNSYQPIRDRERTMLGEAQWKWLEQQLNDSADVRIIATSIQFGHAYNGWESWTNLPDEQERMLRLIRNTRAEGVVFISGDVHWGELSCRRSNDAYPIYDLTASGLTEDWETIEPNEYRIGSPTAENHFGLIEIDWHDRDPSVSLQIVNHRNQVKLRHRVQLATLTFSAKQEP